MRRKSLSSVLSFITNHPLNKKRRVRSAMRFIQWQVLNLARPGVVRQIQYGQHSKLHIKKGLAGATGNYYCGLHDYEEMLFLLHFLRDDDLFLDVGANIGSYSVLASTEIGCRCIAFEPAPETFNWLQKNIALNNQEDLCKTVNKGVGQEAGKLRFSSGLDAVNHVVADEDIATIEVPVTTIDSEVKIDRTCLVKIDVEGFETPVIRGMKQNLEQDQIKAIIIELNGSGDRYGFDEEKIHAYLLEQGFKPYSYSPSERSLIELEQHGATNTIYIRDLQFVEQRLNEAKTVIINGLNF